MQEVKPCLMAWRISRRMPSSSRLLKSGVKVGKIKLPSLLKCSRAQSFFSERAARDDVGGSGGPERSRAADRTEADFFENCLRFILTPN